MIVRHLNSDGTYEEHEELYPLLDGLVQVPPISDRQFFQQLAVKGIVSPEEALEAVKVGTLPAAIETFVAAMPAAQQFAARMVLSGATFFERSHPLVDVFGSEVGMGTLELDQFWFDARQIR